MLRPWRFENYPCCCQTIQGFSITSDADIQRGSVYITQNPIIHLGGFTVVVEIGSCLHDSAPIPFSSPPTITVLCPLSLIGTLLVRLDQPFEGSSFSSSSAACIHLICHYSVLVNSKHFRDGCYSGTQCCTHYHGRRTNASIPRQSCPRLITNCQESVTKKRKKS